MSLNDHTFKIRIKYVFGAIIYSARVVIIALYLVFLAMYIPCSNCTDYIKPRKALKTLAFLSVTIL